MQSERTNCLWYQRMIVENKYKVKLIKQLYGREELPVSDLSKGIRKSIPFTTSLINEMVEDEILEERGLAKSKGGRRAQLYSFKENIFFTVGVAVDQLSTSFTIFDLQGNQVMERISKNILLTKTGEDLKSLGTFISKCIEESGIAKERILGVGIGMPGFIDVKKGVNHSFLKIEKGDIVTYLEDSINLPVFIDNDSSLIGLAELRQGWARDRENTLVINIGWGVGLGIIISHKVFRGENGFAGEFSHIPLFENKKVCSCGKLGCLETETSLYVLIEKAREGLSSDGYTILPKELPDDRTEAVKVIFNAIEQGDAFSLGLLKELGQNLGRGISTLIHLFNPGLIVLSGLGSIPGKFWLPPVQQAINEHSIGKLAEDTELKISNLGPSAELVGAAALVIERLEEINKKNKEKLIMPN